MSFYIAALSTSNTIAEMTRISVMAVTLVQTHRL
jgi:hypothetical protein